MADPSEARLARLFQHAHEAVFLLDSRRRLIFFNAALARLLGPDADHVHGLTCRRYRQAEAGSPEAWCGLLAPPPEALAGQPARSRRQVPGAGLLRRWWDIDFWPVRGKEGVAAILGRVLPLPTPPPPALAKLSEELIALRQGERQRQRLDLLSSACPALQRAARQARLACQSRVPVLLRGERGTGKEWLARAIHAQGPTAEGPLVALDGRRLPPAAVAAALTHWQARAGTLYLQEPQCFPRELQQDLADRLADPEAAGPRILAGSSSDPLQEVKAGRWLDAWHDALATLVIDLPPLRHRLDDLPVLVEQLAGSVPLASAAWELLRRHPWPGNLDELRRVLADAAGRAGRAAIEPPHLPAYVRQAAALQEVEGRAAERSVPLDAALEQVERRLIQQALKQARGNKTKAAELLAIWRPRLLRRMEALGIADPEGEKPAANDSTPPPEGGRTNQ